MFDNHIKKIDSLPSRVDPDNVYRWLVTKDKGATVHEWTRLITTLTKVVADTEAAPGETAADTRRRFAARIKVIGDSLAYLAE